MGVLTVSDGSMKLWAEFLGGKKCWKVVHFTETQSGGYAHGVGHALHGGEEERNKAGPVHGP